MRFAVAGVGGFVQKQRVMSLNGDAHRKRCG
jgi:hypothetical protein